MSNMMLDQSRKMYEEVKHPKEIFLGPRLPRKLYNPMSISVGRAKMTIVLGMRCRDGVVLCADRQLTVPGNYKYSEEKIDTHQGNGWIVAIGYAGDPRLMKEASAQIGDQLYSMPGEDITVQGVRGTVVNVLKGMGRLDTKARTLWMLVAVATVLERPELFLFNSKKLDVAENFNCIGVGDSALIRYLSSSFYSPQITLRAAQNLGIYIVKQAKDFIDWCGGKTDLVLIQSGTNWEWLKESSADYLESELNLMGETTFIDFLGRMGEIKE